MDKQEFIDECLREHNKYRSLHGTTPLRHSIHLDKTAQEWADDLVLKDNLQNSPVSSKGDVGENISMRKSTSSHVTLSGPDVSKQWYDDSKNYDFAKGTGPAGNFTQMVWRATEEVGFGISHSQGKCIVVAHYKPAGNVKGCYLDNVKPLLGSSAAAPVASHDDSKISIQSPYFGDQNSQLDKELVAYMRPLTHSRTSSISSDEHFEMEIRMNPDIQKASQRQTRKFIRDTTAAINKCRVKHGVPKLKHSKQLDNIAQAWANELVKKSTLSNSNNVYKGDRVGESIASRWSNGVCDYTADQVVDHWYLEHSKFTYGKEPANVQGIGNFTQMVWKSAKEIGIGKAFLTKDGDCRVIVVCNYYPAGNVLRRFLENVLPPTK